MSKNLILLAASMALIGVAGCATRQTSEASEARTLATPAATNTPRGSSATAELRGETATVYGDDETATKLLERSVADKPTALGEFNLAAAYSRTGRPNEAVAMYRRAIGSGTNQMAIRTSKVGGADIDERFNIADESRLRIARVQASMARGVKDARSLTDAQAAKADAAK